MTVEAQPPLQTNYPVALGRYHQPPPFIWLVGDPGNAGRLEPLRADQAVLGVQRLLGRTWRWQVEGFAKRDTHYAARVFCPNAVLQPSGFDDACTDIPFGLAPLASSGRGVVWGGEAQVQKKLDEVPGYAVASVSYNHTSFTGLDGTSQRGAFDTPIVANVVTTGLQWDPRLQRVDRSVGLKVLPTIGVNWEF